MRNQSNQGNPYQFININSYPHVNPSYHGSDINQANFENPANNSISQADTGNNYSSIPYSNDPYLRPERLSPQQMIARSNRFNIPYSNEGSPLNYYQVPNHEGRRENLQVPASLLDISSLIHGANQVQNPNLEYLPFEEFRQPRSSQGGNYLPDFQVSQVRDQLTNPRRDPSLSQISSQQSGYIGSIPSIEENIRQAQQIIDLHEQTARRVQAQNKRREGQPWI